MRQEHKTQEAENTNANDISSLEDYIGSEVKLTETVEQYPVTVLNKGERATIIEVKQHSFVLSMKEGHPRLGEDNLTEVRHHKVQGV